MIAKVLCLAVVVVAATAHPHGHVAVSSQVIHRHDGPVEEVVRRDHDEHGHGREHVDYHAHPNYEYAYSVEDNHTGDIKSQHETRDGDVVRGYYSLVQPDGSVRHVEYYADQHTGFHANVTYTHPLHHVEPHREHH